MKIEILHFDGCPTYRTTGETLRQVLAEEGLEADIELVAVNSDEEAKRLPRKPNYPRRRSRPFSHARARGLAIGLPGLCYP